MASDQKAVPATSLACKCLNVRITTSAPPTAPPDYPRDADYTPFFVKDDGISVTHPQVTVRLTSPGIPIPGTSRCSRFVALTCLFCELLVYRVHQNISLDVDGTETTLLPSDEWVEHEILKSATGWIDIHKDSIAGDNITTAESSSSYASLFSLLLPTTSPPPALSPKLFGGEILPEVEPPSEPDSPLPSFFSDLKPVFLPPPFTSSNPVFVHLAGMANKRSLELRSSAEDRIRAFIKSETTGIEEQERDLRRQVEVLWKNFRRHLTALQEERGKLASTTARSPSRSKEVTSPTGRASPSAASSSITVRSFVPMRVSSSVLSPSSIPRISALSASLATSRFHHPREAQRGSSSTEDSTDSNDSGSSGSVSSRSGSSTLVHPIHQVDGTNVLQFKRNINDTINTEASYRYFVNLEEDMQRYKRSQQSANEEVSGDNQQAGPSTVQPRKEVNGTKKSEPQSLAAAGVSKPGPDTTPSRGRDKGKRKVTFDVEPAVVTIEKEEKGDEETAAQDARVMIFELEDLEPGEGADKLDTARQNTLPLLEQAATRPARSKRLRPQTSTAIDTFNSLRPSSLPTPSHIRPLRSQPGVDSSSQGMMLSHPRAPAVISTSRTQASGSSSQKTANELDAELLKLVAADTPSHRGAWAPDSRAWQTFTRRQDQKDDVDHEGIPEEGDNTEDAVVASAPVSAKISEMRKVLNTSSDDEGDDSDELRNVAGSLPVNIANRLKPRGPLSLSSYRPQNALPTLPEQDVASNSTKQLSSTSIRKATYAERDRARSLDPGPLDFAAEEEDAEEEVDDEDDSHIADDAGEKSRKKALRILQARSELPEEGMWRSLA